MNPRLEDRHSAIKLRRRGYSYSEIMDMIPNLSKGTLSGWLKNIELTDDQKKRLLQKICDGSERSRFRGSLRNKEKAVERIINLQKKAEDEYQRLDINPLFKVGLCLYWAEGAKKSRSFQFVNSDPQMISLELRWLREILCVEENEIKIRIYIHEIYKDENCEKFWSEVTKISKERFFRTIYKPTQHKIKKNPGYKGCCRLDITKSEIYWKIVKWQQMMIDSL